VRDLWVERQTVLREGSWPRAAAFEPMFQSRPRFRHIWSQITARIAHKRQLTPRPQLVLLILRIKRLSSAPWAAGPSCRRARSRCDATGYLSQFRPAGVRASAAGLEGFRVSSTISSRVRNRASERGLPIPGMVL